MEIKIVRDIAKKEFTMGKLTIDGRNFSVPNGMCYTLEDERRIKKVKGETAIGDSRYQIKFREVLSDKTKKYREKYPWFVWHLWVTGVPGFQYIYIHVGNKTADSDGCILVGGFRDVATGQVLKSVFMFEALYKKVSKALVNNEEVWLTIEETEEVDKFYSDLEV